MAQGASTHLRGAVQAGAVALDDGRRQDGDGVLGEGGDASRHHQQQARRRGVVALPHQHSHQKVRVHEMQGRQQGGCGGGAVPLQLQARVQQLVAGGLAGEWVQ